VVDPPSPAYPDFGAPGLLPGSLAASDDPAVPSPLADAGASTPSGEQAQPSPQLDPAAAIGEPGFKYGAVFGLPLALLAFVWYFGAALTRDPA
jgi:hypothetical protein